MKPTALCRAYSLRVLTSCVCGDVSIVKAVCFLLMLVIVFVVATNNSPTVLTSDRGLKLEINDIQKDSINTVLIENANGNYYIAFEMPKGSETFRKIKESVGLSELLRSKNSSQDQTSSNEKSEHSALEMKSKNNSDTKLTENNDSPKMNLIYPLSVYDNPYYINNERVCDTGKNLTFLVLVHSATGHFSRRISIRETWANKKLFKNHEIRIVFLLGKPAKDSTQVLIEHENSLYRDIVQGNFLDTYHNLTHKAVLGLRWVVEHCRNTKLIIKVDDDVFLNVFQLLEDTGSIYSNKSRAIFCGIRHVNTSRIERSGKWKVDENHFTNMTFYPVKYCNGFFAVITPDIFPALYEAAKSTPFFWIDDVYLFGLLTDKIGGVTFTGVANLNLNENRAIECFQSRNTTCKFLVATAWNEGVMDKMWYNAMQHYKELARKYSRNDLF